MKRTYLTLCSLLAAAACLTGCGNASAAPTDSPAGTSPVTAEPKTESGTDAVTEAVTAAKKTEVVAAVNSEPKAGWDPVTGYGQRYDPILQSTLTKAYGGEITNDLAVSHEVSEDGMEWTFRIRDDAFYSNGEKVTAGDVAFTYEAVRDKTMPTVRQWQWQSLSSPGILASPSHRRVLRMTIFPRWHSPRPMYSGAAIIRRTSSI